ncbi:aminotransferase-like domain-containing protein [Shewanella woodyi]|uniref:Transcriptional regulator, GntR family with aminotransferase domain n=1 Tax=Shewanella woodyi (strain ATCC 51908 / MS32) TaxID=392500 RepID=B1KQL1_SHEWM|nr:PLP-dependent aminotransferase family protein [Shewanella woodyi]ACA86250.1 transcriptional regulator, GntR family with aminotransferase domain [Shewanella woodyi ATCC 51908]
MGTIWSLDLNEFSGPKYVRIVTAIEQAIHSGELTPNSKLPPQRQLADTIGVTIGTITRAYALAEQRGYVEARRGDGTYVKAKVQNTESSKVNFATCQPPLTNQTATLSDILTEIAKDPITLNQIMGYQADPLTHQQQAFHHWLTTRGIEQDSKQLIFCHGAQQGLFSVLNALLGKSDVLMHEENCYPGIRVAANQLGLDAHSIPLTDSGLDLMALQTLVEQYNPKLLYLTLNNQNPTCIQYSMSQRQTLLKMAIEHDFYILEDDVNYCLPEEWHLPLWQQAREHSVQAQSRVIYLSSLSKTFSGGLRQGFILLPEALIAPVKLALHSQCWMVSPLNMEIAARLINTQALVGERDLLIRERQALAISMCDRLNLQHRWRGLNGWLKLNSPLKAHHVVTALAAKGILVRNGDDFDNHDNHIRISIGAAQNLTQFIESLQEIETTIQTLSQSAYSVV